MALLAGFATSFIAFCLGHQVEALALTFPLTFAGVLSGHAIVLAFAAIHAEALHFGSFRILSSLGWKSYEQAGSNKRQRSTSGGGSFGRHISYISWS